MKRITLTFGEEIANSITHGIGALLSIAAFILLTITGFKHGSAADITGVMIFGIGMFLLYLMSTLCHAFALSKGKAKKLFTIIDQSAIYILIASTYTPFCMSIIGGTKGLVILAIQWTLAIIGIVMRAVFYDKYTPFHIAIYLLMGWMVVFFIKSFSSMVSMTGFVFLIVGGLSYSIGIVFYAIRMFKFHHMIWHLWVIAGTTFHFFMIFFYVLPR